MIRAAVLAFVAITATALAQQPAASPKPAPATPAVVPVFEVARVNPGKSVKTRAVQVENLGRNSTVLVGEAALTRTHLSEVKAGSEKMKVTSGAKPETREVAVLSLRFTKDGRKALAELSRAAQGQLLAVLIDGKVIAMPKVTEPITSGEWTVSGNFTADAAKGLAAKVNSAK